MHFSSNELLLGYVILLPVAFFIGRYSTRIAFFHAKSEEKLSVPEFVRQRQR